MTTKCWIGVAVAGPDLFADFDDANAGRALGPRAVISASSSAIAFLGASDDFKLLNIFPPERHRPVLHEYTASTMELHSSGWRCAEKDKGRTFHGGCTQIK